MIPGEHFMKGNSEHKQKYRALLEQYAFEKIKQRDILPGILSKWMVNINL